MSEINKAKILYWSKNCIETIEAAMKRRPNDITYQHHCNGKIHTHKLLREHIIRGTFEDDN